MNCGFQHQGGATSTAAPAVLETELQFSVPRPDSSFLGLFLAKRIPSSSRGISTPWVQLNTHLGNITLFESECHGKTEGLVRIQHQKRKIGLQALFGLDGFSDTLASLKRGAQGRVSKKVTRDELGSSRKGMQRLSACDPAGPFLSFKNSLKRHSRVGGNLTLSNSTSDAGSWASLITDWKMDAT